MLSFYTASTTKMNDNFVWFIFGKLSSWQQLVQMSPVVLEIISRGRGMNRFIKGLWDLTLFYLTLYSTQL